MLNRILLLHLLRILILYNLMRNYIILMLLLSSPLYGVQYGILKNTNTSTETEASDGEDDPNSSFWSNESVTLYDGDLLEVISFSKDGNDGANSYNFLIITFDDGTSMDFGIEALLSEPEGDSSMGDVSESLKFIVGPCVLKIASVVNAYSTDPDGDGNNTNMICYKLTRASEVQTQNVNIVSVPTDVQSSDTHSIVVETSSDLVTWNPAYSSPIAGGDQAFVRTRIVIPD